MILSFRRYTGSCWDSPFSSQKLIMVCFKFVTRTAFITHWCFTTAEWWLHSIKAASACHSAPTGNRARGWDGTQLGLELSREIPYQIASACSGWWWRYLLLGGWLGISLLLGYGEQLPLHYLFRFPAPHPLKLSFSAPLRLFWFCSSSALSHPTEGGVSRQLEGAELLARVNASLSTTGKATE